MAVDGDGFRPAEAAEKLGLPASTLRVYSVRFGELLSEGASEPPPTSEGKPGMRLYTAQDLGVLRRAKDLLGRGMTYDRAVSELRESLPGARLRAKSPVAEETGRAAGAGVSPVQVESLVKVLVGAAMVEVEKIAGAWQRLAEERARENAELRTRVKELEARLQEGSARRPGLFGR